MKIGIVPTKYGYSAVALPPYDGDWELSTPIELPHDVKVQLHGQILHKLAIYCQEFKPWMAWKAVIPWAVWGGLAMYLRWSRLWKASPKFLLLYGWVMLFFFADGLRLLIQHLYHYKGLIDAYRIREGAALGKWVSTDVEMPRRIETDSTLNEQEYIEVVRKLCPQTEPYYAEMLREEEPFLFSVHPLGFIGFLRRMFLGPKIPRPGLICDLGTLDET